jgi:hypothetical protein
MRGLRVRAFKEFEEALQWLSNKAEDDDESQKAEVPVPITQPLRHPQKLPLNLSTRRLSHVCAPKRSHRTMHHEN